MKKAEFGDSREKRRKEMERRGNKGAGEWDGI